MAYAWAASLSKADKGLSSTKRVDDEVFLTLKMLIVVRRATVGPQCTDRHKTPLRHSLSPRRYQCPYNASAIERSLSSGSKSKFAGRYASCRSKLSFATADLGERSTHFAAA